MNIDKGFSPITILIENEFEAEQLFDLLQTVPVFEEHGRSAGWSSKKIKYITELWENLSEAVDVKV